MDELDLPYSKKVLATRPEPFKEKVRIYMLKYIVEHDNKNAIIEYEEKLRP